MSSKKIILSLFALVFAMGFVSPVFALGGTLNVTGYNLGPSYVNTNSSYGMLNLSLNSTLGDVNITSIVIGLSGSSSAISFP